MWRSKDRRLQRQRGAAGSVLVQVAGDYNTGLSEARAIQITREQAQIAVRGFTEEAMTLINERLACFNDELISELARNGLLQALADPAFQVILRKSQLQAASVSSEVDQEFIVKLLTERARDPSKRVTMVITRAIELVSEIDDEALMGLTLMWYVISVRPTGPDPKEGFRELDEQVSKILRNSQLPSGSSWLRRLDLMNCVRYEAGSLQPMLKWSDILTRFRRDYVAAGIHEAAAPEFRQRLASIDKSLERELVPNAFRPGWFRLNSWGTSLFPEGGNAESIQAKMDEVESLVRESGLDTAGTAELISPAREFIDNNLPSLAKLISWWDGLTGVATITPLGMAIGYSNAKRFDPFTGFPSLLEMVTLD